MPWNTCSRPVQTKMGKNGFPTETPDFFWPFWWPVVGGDTFSSLAPILGPVRKMVMSHSLKLTARGGEYDIKMCKFCKRHLWGGGFRQLASTTTPRHRNTRNIILTLMNGSRRGRHGHFFFQDLCLALRVVAKTCPHRPRVLEKAKMIKSFRSFFFFFFLHLFSERGDCRYSKGWHLFL